MLAAALLLPALPVADSMTASEAADVTADVTAEVRLSYQPERRAWTADYRLSEPVRVFHFSDRGSGPLRSENWVTGDDALTVHDDRLESVAPFEVFSLQLPADRAEHNRIYPAAVAVGQGSLINISYLLGGHGTKVIIDVAQGQVLASPEREMPVTHKGMTLMDPHMDEYYLYVGPGPVQQFDSFRLTIGDEVPEWIEPAVHSILTAAIDEYASFLGIEQPVKPSVYVSTHDSETPDCSFRGDVANHGLTSLRLRGRCWAARDENVEAVRKFVRHEAFHYWNRGSRVNATQPWLHEGAADYFAAFGTARLEPVLLECWESGSPYFCGHAANLIGDRLLGETEGAAMRDAWRAVLRQRQEYGPEDLFSAATELGAAPDFQEIALNAIDEPDAATRRFTIERLRLDPARFAGIGSRTRLATALRHVLSTNCAGSHGFWTLTDAVRLDARDCGGGLVDRAVVAAIDGIPLAEAGRAVQAIVDKCGTARLLEFSGPGGESFQVKCRQSLHMQ